MNIFEEIYYDSLRCSISLNQHSTNVNKIKFLEKGKYGEIKLYPQQRKGYDEKCSTNRADYGGEFSKNKVSALLDIFGLQ